MKHDSEKIYTYIPLQSEKGKTYLTKYNLPIDDFDTVILIENDKAYTASTAVLLILKNLSGFIQYLYVFIIIPPFLRDYIYKLIAKNRYTFFGKKKSCTIDKQHNKD